jgi:hypothetical protein
MHAWKLLSPVRAGALVLVLAGTGARAGHEVPYYPSFYPQEIRIEALDADRAAAEFSNTTDPLHAYLGAAPRFADAPPAHLKSIGSLGSFIMARANPQSPRLTDRKDRCTALGRARVAIARDVEKQKDVLVHPYPITPFHADYLGHADLASDTKLVAAAPGEPSRFAPHVPAAPAEWDVAYEEVDVARLVREAAGVANVWMAPPWAKDGWFQAYHLLRDTTAEPADRKRADEIYERLAEGEFHDLAERLNLERELVAVLKHGCERAVVGYRVRREFYNDDFSGGIENILVDAHNGFNSPVFVRTVKLKDFPWNGWLRLGMAERPQAAWNPVAGFTDAPGRLVWSALADNAFLPIPHNSRWVQNRVEVRPEEEKPKQSLRVPDDAIMPERGSGRLVKVGATAGAMSKVTYRVLAAAFHDGSEMEVADLLYPYALAARWGASETNGVFDPDIAAATRLMRERLRGVRPLRVEESVLRLADLAFTYHSPIVEVYLDTVPTDEQEGATLAPPWSSVPWHLLALMEAAVERGIAAFSAAEASRRNLPWLDLARDPDQLAKLRALIKEFSATGWRPAALADLVGAEAAKARWQTLDQFAETNGHLLVANGPYRLASTSPDAIVLNVVREFTYPIGIGTFDPFAYPPRALVTRIEQVGRRVFVTADIETAVKQQRDRKITRAPLRRDTTREIYPIRPEPRWVLIGPDHRVAAAGSARWESDGRFAVTLPATLPPSPSELFVGIFVDGNTIIPDIGRFVIQGE